MVRRNTRLYCKTIFINNITNNQPIKPYNKQWTISNIHSKLNEALPLVKEDKVWTRVDPVLQVDVVDEYSFAV